MCLCINYSNWLVMDYKNNYIKETSKLFGGGQCIQRFLFSIDYACSTINIKRKRLFYFFVGWGSDILKLNRVGYSLNICHLNYFTGHNSMIYFVDDVGPSPLAQNVAFHDLPLRDVGQHPLLLII